MLTSVRTLLSSLFRLRNFGFFQTSLTFFELRLITNLIEEVFLDQNLTSAEETALCVPNTVELFNCQIEYFSYRSVAPQNHR